MFEIGTYQWSKRSQGYLSQKEKFRIVGMLVKAQVIDFVERGRYMLGWSKDSLARLDFEAIIRPDSKLALAAEELCQELHSPRLANHCYRTYYWGALLGQVDGFSVDAELLYVGSLLHDLGLSDKYSPEATHSCFALNGANIAYKLALEHDWDDAQAEALYNCIGLHLNPLVSATEHGPEAKLLGNGAYLDILGLRHYCLTAEVIKRVDERHPREDFVPEILMIMKEIKHPPDTRSGFMSKIGFDFMAKRNPLDKE
jgi:hypothetical protein